MKQVLHKIPNTNRHLTQLRCSLKLIFKFFLTEKNLAYFDYRGQWNFRLNEICSIHAAR